MATYTTKRCPHCGHAYVYHSRSNQFYWGSPFKVCEECGEAFVDKDGHEMAADYPDVNSAISSLKAKSNISAILYIVLGAGMVIGLLSELGSNTGSALLGMAFGAFFLYLGIKGLSSTNSGETIDFITSEYSESLDRFTDPSYVEAYNRIAKKPYIQKTAQQMQEAERKATTKQPPNNAPRYSTAKTGIDRKEATTVDSNFVYCRKCGARIPSDSAFCQKCGEQVVHIE